MTVIAAPPDHSDSEPPVNDTSERMSFWSDEDELLSFPPREGAWWTPSVLDTRVRCTVPCSLCWVSGLASSVSSQNITLQARASHAPNR